MLFVACLAYASVLSVPASLAQAATARSGTLEAVVTDNPRTGHSITRYTLKSGRKRVPVQPTELAAEPGDRVTVTGKFRDGRLVGAVEATSPSAQAVTPGPRKAAVLLVTFPGDPAEPWSPATSRSEVFTAANSASAFYAEESYGEVSLTGKLNADGDVFGWLSLDTPTAGCPWSTWKDKADEAASDAGIDLSGYRHVIYEFQWQSSCSWLGKAALGGGWAMINGNLFGFRHRVTVHELGHNLGLLHAGSWRCTADGVRVQISDTCTVGEYGDPFDAMGNIATRHNNGWNLAKLGFLAPENVETVSGSGNYSIRSALSPTAEPTVLRTPRKRDLDGKIASWYYLEVRKTGGVFENVSDASTEGVSIRATAAKSSAETLLLDANPSTSTFQDAPLGAEQTFDGGPVQIETLTAGGGSATVSIELDEEPPSAPPGLAATPGFEKVQLQWDASADDFGVGRYVVFRDGVEVGASASTGFTDSPVALGEHTYVVYAEDETGNQSAASGAVAVTVVPDEEPPTAPTGLTAAAVADGVQLQWGASADDFGVDRYRVFRDGDSIGVPAGTSFLDSLVSAGEHTYVVYAEDETGNQSAASAPATVAVPAISGPVCAGGSCRVTFRYSGVAATWTVPPGVGKAEFTVAGARGSGPGINLGARVVATLGSLTPEEDVTVSVGGMGQPYSEGGAGGFNGGGDGALGGGGGGYSSVALGDPLTLMLLAGGGGGEGGEGFNAVTEQEPRGGWGGQGGEVGTGGSFLGRATEAHGATLGGGEGGAPGGSFDPPFTDGAGGAGGEVTGTSSCAGGAFAGAPGDSGESLEGGGGTPDAGGGGGGGYFGGGQGGAGAGDACGSRAGAGGGGGGSSYADGELSAEFDGGVRSSDGEVSIAYANPIGAVAHSYTTTPDQELVVPADSGVLAGATAPGGDPLSASVESGPAHGELTLDGDGSLTYTPAPEYAGNDSFSYRAAGPSGNYATAQATLTIAEPPSASISAPADGATYALGQTVEAGFSCAEGEGGPGVSSCTGTVADGEPLDTSAAGSHTFTATATSEDGLTDQASSTYTVEAPAPPPSPASESEPAPPVPVPPPPSISIGGGFAPVAQRSTSLWLGCEGPAGTVCRGRLLLRTRGRIALRRRPAYKRAIVLGRTRYAIPAGETRPVGVRLEKVALRLLKRTRHNRLRITATAAGRPGANRTVVLAPNRELRRVLVRYRRSGGFAGSSAGLVVARNGSARSGTSRTRLNRRVRARLGRALRRARFASLESNYEPAVPIADAFTHLIAYRGRTIRAVDTAAPPRLQAVIEILGQVLATLRAEQRNP